MSAERAVATNVMLVESPAALGQQRSLAVEIETQGNENALGFSVIFDPTRYTFVRVEKSDEASQGTLNVNDQAAEKGRIGIGIALPTGHVYGVGKHQVVILTFEAREPSADPMIVGFGDLPVNREVVDVNANPVRTMFHAPEGINPLEDPQFFVAQHYLDFFFRPADAEGLDYWTDRIRQCGSDATCVAQRRLEIGSAFFAEPEFQKTGYMIYRVYKAALGRRPTYAEFTADRSRLLPGPDLAASTSSFLQQFVTRSEFISRYPEAMTSGGFAQALSQMAGLTNKRGAAERIERSRGQILLDFIDNNAFKQREYAQAFITMQYFNYLHRDPDQEGFNLWLNNLNGAPGNFSGVTCSFLSSREYQERFGAVITGSNQQCGR
jgi:hypothetical protein